MIQIHHESENVCSHAAAFLADTAEKEKHTISSISIIALF